MIDVNGLIDKINIVEYISQYVDLQERNGEYIGISPLSHKDINPSFTITPEKQLWHDFSYGCGGNIFNFIMKYHNVNFKESLKIACAYVGDDIKELPESLEVTKAIKKFKQKPTNQKQVKYKKLSNDIMQKYNFDLDKLKSWIDFGITIDVLKKYQVMYDVFSDRIIFPIQDEFGNIINIKGRILKENITPKYSNYYEIGRVDYLFNLNFAKEEIKKKNKAIIVEAEKSVMLLESWGVHNSLATMTSRINDDQLKILIKLGCDIIVAFDKDVNITKDKNIQKLKRYARVQYIEDKWNLLDEKDSPVDRGKNVFKQLYFYRFTLN